MTPPDDAVADLVLWQQEIDNVSADKLLTDAEFDAMTVNQREAWAWDPHPELTWEAQHARKTRLQEYDDARRPPKPMPTRPAAEPESDRLLFADLAAILDGGLRASAPDGGPARTDGKFILYTGKVNALIGDPESAKTLFALCVIADAMLATGQAVFIDTDHNGPDFVLGFLLAVGVPRETLLAQFRYAEPEDRQDLLLIVDALAEDFDALVIVLDSVGENLSLWGVSPNDDQGFIDMNRATAARLAKAGHLVITIDHLAKNVVSRDFGATGSTAKKRAVDGAMYQVVIVNEFSPTSGGQSALLLKKDRTGGVRALGYKRDQTVAHFEVNGPDRQTGVQTWALHPGSTNVPTAAAAKAAAKAGQLSADVTALDGLTPPPKSKEDVMARMKWGTARALAALNAWRNQASTATGGQP